jgi:hypothetical protein
VSRALFDSVENKRTIIDRRSIADGLAAVEHGRLSMIVRLFSTLSKSARLTAVWRSAWC